MADHHPLTYPKQLSQRLIAQLTLPDDDLIEAERGPDKRFLERDRYYPGRQASIKQGKKSSQHIFGKAECE